MIDWRDDVPRWVQVYEVIRGRIETGEYPPGSKLPSVLQLQADYGIATATAQKVLHKLRDDGLTSTQPGLGTFVKRLPTPED